MARRQRKRELAASTPARRTVARRLLASRPRGRPCPLQGARRGGAGGGERGSPGGGWQLSSPASAPPDYICPELGERPADPTKRKAWERDVELTERYRQEHGISDCALGAEPKDRAERVRREARLRRLCEVKRELGREAGLARTRERQCGLAIAR